MKTINSIKFVSFIIMLSLTQSVFAGGTPLTNNDLNLKTAINSDAEILDVLSNDESGIINDDFKEVIAVCAISTPNLNCVSNSYTDGIGTVTVNGVGNQNNVNFNSNHNQTHDFEFKYIMRNSNANTDAGEAQVNLSYFEVNNTSDSANNVCDSSECSLRAAIDAASNDGEPSDIAFKRNMLGNIELNSGLVIDSNDLSIIGPGASRIKLSGNDLFRVLSIPSGTERFTLSGLTISNGVTQNNGGGILIDGALDVRLENIRVTDNTAESNGGGIYTSNSGLILVSSEVSHNSADTNGSGINITGGFGSDVTIENTTISSNYTPSLVGSGLNINTTFGQTTTLKFVTVAFNNNNATNSNIEGTGNIIIESSVFEPDLSISNSNNIINNTLIQNTVGSVFGTNNLGETGAILNPHLVEINDSGFYGHWFNTSGLAYNHVDDMVGDASCGNQITTDQFGNNRPIDGACDAGAFEYNQLLDIIFNSDFD